MLAVAELTVRFGRHTALDRVSLRVPVGEVLAVLGPSGSGKSTLLRAIAGLEPVAGGTVRCDGQDVTAMPAHRRGFALMFQDGQLFEHRDVAGNVGYALRVRHRPRAEIAQRVGELLYLVGLSGYESRRPATLSGGERQRVALARSLAARPRLLLLDEPLSSLDRELRDRLAADLRALLTATGSTAILVTHDEGEAAVIADRAVRMAAGRLHGAANWSP
jgi:thiamine transport system ATP-binding protein